MVSSKWAVQAAIGVRKNFVAVVGGNGELVPSAKFCFRENSFYFLSYVFRYKLTPNYFDLCYFQINVSAFITKEEDTVVTRNICSNLFKCIQIQLWIKTAPKLLQVVPWLSAFNIYNLALNPRLRPWERKIPELLYPEENVW